MRTKMKNILVTLLVGMMVLGALAVNVGANEQSARQKWLDQINRIRKEAYDEKLVDSYVPIQWSNDMEQIASIRSTEATANGFGPTIHKRPDGAGFWTALSESGQSSQSEIISSTPDYGMSINLWYSEKGEFLKKQAGADSYGETGHYEALIDPNLQYIGLSAVNGGFTVGELTSRAGVVPDPAPVATDTASTATAAPVPATSDAAPTATEAPAPAVTVQVPAQRPAAETAAVSVPTPTAPAAATPVASDRAAANQAMRELTPVSVSLIKAMGALAHMTKEIPEMTPVVADVNAAISQVIPVVESAAAEEQPVPQTEVSVPVQVIDPTVSQYIAEAEAWIETAYELLEE